MDFSHVNIHNSGLCASHLVILLSQWLLRHGTLIVQLKLTGYNFSKSLLICCVIKNCYRFQCHHKIVRTLKISQQFNLIDTTYSSGFHAGLGGGGGVTKLKQCKQTTGPKSVGPGAEMHRTGGRNPSYHVIMVICACGCHRWILHTKASDAELWCFLWSAPK